MKTAIAWFARNRVAANLLMFVFIFGGLSSVLSIPQKPFPDINIDMISVGIAYPGAAPEEVEEGVCVRIEEEIAGVDGIEEIRSTSLEGSCGVFAELRSGTNLEQAYNDIKNQVDSITTFPELAEKPIISRVSIRRPVVDLAIYGAAEERALRSIATQVRDELAELPEITQVDLILARPFEISIEIPEANLRRFGLSFGEIAEAIRRSSLDIPGGTVKTAGGQILLRAKGQAYRGPDFEKILIRTRPDGTRLTLGNVATIVDDFEDTDVSATFDGHPAVMVQVYRVGDQDVIEISNAVKAYVAKTRTTLPEGVQLDLWQDDSKTLRARLDTLLRNGRSGFLLVLLVLALFLRARLAFWTTLGVPVAFLGALWTFNPLGVSINVISLFAFILVLGILVDDATVVAESIYTHQREMSDPVEGAIKGTVQVAIPVIFGVLTTVATFTPMVMVPGPMGQVFAVIGSVVIVCLLCSLIESQLVLPAHLAHSHQRSGNDGARTGVGRFFRRIQQFFGDGLLTIANGIYRKTLITALEWRYATIALALVTLFLALSVLGSGRMRFSFFPPIEADYLAARLTMPQGTPIEVTAEAAGRIESSVAELRTKIVAADVKGDGDDTIIQHVLAAVGTQPFKNRQNSAPSGLSGSDESSHYAEVVLGLVESEARTIATSEVAKQWRELVGSIPDAVELVFASDLFSAGDAINIELKGFRVDELRAAAGEVKRELSRYPGVIDIADSFRAGKRELQLRVRPTAEVLGLGLEDLGRQVRQAFYGEEVQRIQRGRDEIRVMLRYPSDKRRSLGDLEGLRIRTPEGIEVPFSTVADLDFGRGYSAIRRTDRKRVVNVTADIDRNKTTANAVLEDLTGEKLRGILAHYPSVSFGLKGEQREQRRAFGGLGRAYLPRALCRLRAPSDPSAFLSSTSNYHECDPIRCRRRDRWPCADG